MNDEVVRPLEGEFISRNEHAAHLAKVRGSELMWFHNWYLTKNADAATRRVQALERYFSAYEGFELARDDAWHIRDILADHQEKRKNEFALNKINRKIDLKEAQEKLDNLDQKHRINRKGMDVREGALDVKLGQSSLSPEEKRNQEREEKIKVKREDAEFSQAQGEVVSNALKQAEQNAVRNILVELGEKFQDKYGGPKNLLEGLTKKPTEMAAFIQTLGLTPSDVEVADAIIDRHLSALELVKRGILSGQF